MAKNQDGVIKMAKQFCCEPIENIEGYQQMIESDDEWCTHHRREISEEKSYKQLIKEGLYWHRPASELVFMTEFDHKSIHGKNRRPETRKKRSDSLKGRKHKEESKKRMSEAQKGKVISDETRRKMSEAQKGKHPSKETLKKLSECHKGTKNYKARAVVKLTLDGEFIKEWSYIRDNELLSNFNPSLIVACCKGKRKHHKGYKWMYKEDWEALQQKKAVI